MPLIRLIFLSVLQDMLQNLCTDKLLPTSREASPWNHRQLLWNCHLKELLTLKGVNLFSPFCHLPFFTRGGRHNSIGKKKSVLHQSSCWYDGVKKKVTPRVLIAGHIQLFSPYLDLSGNHRRIWRHPENFGQQRTKSALAVTPRLLRMHHWAGVHRTISHKLKNMCLVQL